MAFWFLYHIEIPAKSEASYSKNFQERLTLEIKKNKNRLHKYLLHEMKHLKVGLHLKSIIRGGKAQPGTTSLNGDNC